MSLSDSATSRSVGYTENYFNIDDILATQEKLPCRFELSVHNLGYLDAGSESEHLQPGTKMELPFWLARALCGRKKHTVTTEIPKQYREGYREIISADAAVVDLHKLGPYFYAFGTHLLGFEHPDSYDIAKSMLQGFQVRLRHIMDSSQNAYNEDTSKLTERLDEVERALFHSGQTGLSDFQRWETRKTEQIVTSSMVVNHRKRKRVQMDV